MVSPRAVGQWVLQSQKQLEKENEFHQKLHFVRHIFYPKEHGGTGSLCAENCSLKIHTTEIEKQVCECCMDVNEANMHTQKFLKNYNQEPDEIKVQKAIYFG